MTGRSPETAAGLFPLPLPYPEAWTGGPYTSRSRRQQRWREAAQIATNVLTLALNHLYEGRPRWAHREALRRHPNASQREMLLRIRMFVGLWGRSTSGAKLCSGRRGGALCEEFRKLEAMSVSLREAIDPYHVVPVRLGKMAVSGGAFRPLDTSRLSMQGPLGWWDV